MAKILSIHDRITCPRKGHPIAVVNRNIYNGDLIRLGRDFDFETTQEKVVGEPLICSVCSSFWMVGDQVHTVDGWKPGPDPQLLR